VLLFGTLLGVPYARAIVRQAPQQIINSWRVAHQSLPVAAGLMFAIAAALPQFAASSTAAWFVVIALIASAYAFCIALPVAAITGHRGLTPDGRGLQKLAYYGNVLGAALSVAAGMGLVYITTVSL